MILVSILTSILFLGGWLSPVGFLPDGFHWLALKTSFILLLFLWARATFPRFRYDHIMRLGWKVFIPVTLVWVFVVAVVADVAAVDLELRRPWVPRITSAVCS
jgi:NADH-quinone oxidoreductase subunit H